LKKYKVDCYGIRPPKVQVNDEVLVKGKTGRFGDQSKIKADKIYNITHPNAPICHCGEPDVPFVSKLLTVDIEKKGIVTEVTEKVEGYWFFIESKE